MRSASKSSSGSRQSANEEESQRKEDEWVAKFSGMADSLNRTVIEKDALRDLQKSEIERQIAMRKRVVRPLDPVAQNWTNSGRR
jgi:hypothetical protein